MSSEFESYHKVLKDKTRRQIIILLKEKKNLSYTDLINTLGIKSTGTLNYHLKVLSELIIKTESGLYNLSEKGWIASRLMSEFSDKNSTINGKNGSSKRKLSVKKILVLSTFIIVLFGVYSIYSNGVQQELMMPPSRESAVAVVETLDGGYAIAGETSSMSIDFNSFLLVKTDENGNMQWNQTNGGERSEEAYAMIVTSDGGYAMAGRSQSLDSIDSDFLLVKTDENGNEEWHQTYDGGDTDRAYSLVETPDGGYALAGDISYSDGDTDAGWSEIWFVKTDENGNMQWDKKFGGWGTERSHAMVATSDGGYAIAGFTDSFGGGYYDYWLIKIDENGNLEWDKTFGGERSEYTYAMIETSDGGYALAGYTNPSDLVPTDIWLVKTDENGNLEWDQTIGVTYDKPWDIVETSEGGFAIVGQSSLRGAGSDVLLVKTDENGNKQWHKIYGSSGSDQGRALSVTSDGGYILAGSTSSYDAVGVDAWLIKVDSDGNMLWNKIFGE